MTAENEQSSDDRSITADGFEELFRDKWLTLVNGRPDVTIPEDEFIRLSTTEATVYRKLLADGTPFEPFGYLSENIPCADRDKISYSRLMQLVNSFDFERDDIVAFHRERMKIMDELYENMKKAGPEALNHAINRSRWLDLSIVDEMDKLEREHLENLADGAPTVEELTEEIDDLQFEQSIVWGLILDNLTELHHRLSREWAGHNRYILTVDGDGGVISKVQPQFVNYGVFDTWNRILRNLGLAMDPDIANSLVNDCESWAYSEDLSGYPKIHGSAEVGDRMLRYGRENKIYFSDKPHEIVIRSGNIWSITVVDNHPHLSYKVKHADRSIALGNVYWDGDQQEGEFDQSNFDSNIYAVADPERYWGVYALLGSIARDMWVCEHVTRHYDTDGGKVNSGGGGGKKCRKKPKNRYIWLPRFKVTWEDRPTRAEVEERVFQVSPAYVTGHVRKVKTPSEEQLELAKRHGVRVPSGYTFVRPHDRAGYETSRKLYKSRSALRTLFGAVR